MVRVPGSSANLGPGFDSLGMAVTLYAEAGIAGDPDWPMPDRARLANEHHPASIAFRRAGGTGELWVRTALPAGRGLGFSGAVRVAGIAAAYAQRYGIGPGMLDEHRGEALALAAGLEGHADNVAASLLGGVTATAGDVAVRVPLGLEPAVVVWIPATTTRTEDSRARLAAQVPFGDAVFNVGRTALLVAALAAGDVGALRVATADRLHQDARLAAAPASRLALDAALQAGAWCAWLSGSGPTVAAMCDPVDAAAVMAALPPEGKARLLGIARRGATINP